MNPIDGSARIIQKLLHASLNIPYAAETAEGVKQRGLMSVLVLIANHLSNTTCVTEQNPTQETFFFVSFPIVSCFLLWIQLVVLPTYTNIVVECSNHRSLDTIFLVGIVHSTCSMQTLKKDSSVGLIARQCMDLPLARWAA